MSEVEVRTATVADVPAMADAWAGGLPHLVRSADALRDMLAVDAQLGRLRTVAVVGGEVAGTAVSNLHPDGAGVVQVVVLPRLSRRGAGTALLTHATDHLRHAGATVVRGFTNGDHASTSFALKHGFELGRSAPVSGLDPREVTAPDGEAPHGLRAVRCDELSDPRAILATHNACAEDDPSGHSLRYTEDEFRGLWWDLADNAPHLSWCLLDGADVVAFSSVQVDQDRRRAWSSMTATLPSYRGRGLAVWLKRRVLADLGAAGITAAYTANDGANVAMLRVNELLGYRPVTTHHNVRRLL